MRVFGEGEFGVPSESKTMSKMKKIKNWYYMHLET